MSEAHAGIVTDLKEVKMAESSGDQTAATDAGVSKKTSALVAVDTRAADPNTSKFDLNAYFTKKKKEGAGRPFRGYVRSRWGPRA